MRLALLLPLALAASCGYHVAGRGDLIPKTIHTVAVPAFGNASTRYKLTDQLPEAIAREFIARTRYRVVSNPDAADAVLNGSVLNFTQGLVVADPATSSASVMQVYVILQVTLTERASGKVIFNRPRMEIRERYQIAVPPQQAADVAGFDQRNFFEETDDALRRVATQTARQVVSNILENF
jgi:RNase P/RNase MRP subunit p29